MGNVRNALGDEVDNVPSKDSRIMTPIRIYTEHSHAEESYWQRFLVHPVRAFWGDGSPQWGEYESAFAFFKDIFQIVPEVEQADIVVLPMTWNFYITHNRLNLADSLARVASDAGKKLFIWVDGDRGIRRPYPNAIILQNSAFRSSRRSDQFVLPGDAKDLTELYFDGKLPIRKKGAVPRVSFCGQGDSKRTFLIAVRNLRSQISYSLHLTQFEPIRPVTPHILLRRKVLKLLAEHPQIEHDFVIRQTSTTRSFRDPAWRQEFVGNMNGSDYAVCVRGTANYSIRFYEALSLGRIPIFIDTDCALPFDDTIDWRSYCIWIDASDLSHMGQRILDYHASITSSQFEELQVACRQLWVERLSREGFYRHFHEYVHTANSL